MKTHNKEETIQLGKEFAQSLKKGTLVLLEGDLGAGKTTFTKGLAQGLEITSKINSPTFVIQKEYEGRLRLIHIDAYRLEGIDQDLGFNDFLDDTTLVVVEWSQFLTLDLPSTYYKISIQTLSEEEREITIEKVTQ